MRGGVNKRQKKNTHRAHREKRDIKVVREGDPIQPELIDSSTGGLLLRSPYRMNKVQRKKHTGRVYWTQSE